MKDTLNFWLRARSMDWSKREDMLMKRGYYILLLGMVLSILAIAGCSQFGHLRASLRPTDHLIAHPDDARVLYEPGARDFADAIVKLMSESVARVESAHYRTFVRPPIVHVCESEDSFYRLSGSRAKAVVTNKLLLSPRLMQEPQHLRNYLTHELSHLHLYQQTGVYKTVSRPAWFNEGMATYVSEGGGAHLISPEQARKAICEGRHFVPNKKENVFRPKASSYWELEHHMFYRQSMMFVAYIKDSDEQAFSRLLLNIQDGMSFDKALDLSLPINLDTLWRDFIREIDNGLPGCQGLGDSSR